MGEGTVIEIRLGGPVRLLVDGRDRTPRGDKVTALMVLLATAPDLTRSRAWLQDKLWSTRAPEKGAASLRQAVLMLRKALGARRDCLSSEPGRIGFRPGAVRVCLAPPASAPGLTATPTEFAEGLDVPDPEFEHWIRDQRRAYAESGLATARPSAMGADASPDPTPPAPPVALFVPDTPRTVEAHTEAPAKTGTLPRTKASFGRRLTRFGLGGVALAAILPLLAVLAGADLRERFSRSEPSFEIAAQARPSIAVLPFQTIGGAGRRGALVEGASRDMVTDLSKFGSLFVVAAESSFHFDLAETPVQTVGAELGVRYVLHGSVQWLDETVRVNASVIETATGRTVWAERFDRPAGELLQVQNDLVRQVVGVIGPVEMGAGSLRKAELARIARLPTDDLQAYDHYLRGIELYRRFAPQDNRLARGEFETAVEIDPGYAKARAKLAWTHLQDFWNGYVDDPEAALALAEDHARRAVALDPREAHAQSTLAAVRLFQRRFDEALDGYARAVSLNPNDADLLMYQGWALSYAGRPEEGLAKMAEAVERNPLHPSSYYWDIAMGHFVAGEYALAAKTLERREPKSAFTHLFLAQSYAMLGDMDRARPALARFRALVPDYTIAVAQQSEPFRRPEDLARFLDAMRRAGLPEGEDLAAE